MVYYDDLYGGVLEGDGNNGSGGLVAGTGIGIAGGTIFTSNVPQSDVSGLSDSLDAKQDTILFDENEFNVVPSEEDPSPVNTYTPNRLYGKTLVCVGDSITYGDNIGTGGTTDNPVIPVYQCDGAGDFSRVSTAIKSYGYQIALRNRMTYYGGGVCGSTLEDISYGFSAAGGRYTRLPDSLDYLLMWFGINDDTMGQVGTITDNTNLTFYGAGNIVLPYLINKYPYAKIGLIVPYGTAKSFCDAVHDLANKYGLGVFDMLEAGTPLFLGKYSTVGVDASISAANIAKFTSDGVHPNLAGHTQLADMIETFLYTL